MVRQTATTSYSRRPIQYDSRRKPQSVALRAAASGLKSKSVPARGKTAAVHKPQHSKVLSRAYVSVRPRAKPRTKQACLSQTKLLFTMALVVFIVGAAVSGMGFYTTQQARAEQAALNKRADASQGIASADNALKPGAAPSTTPVQPDAFANYQVAPDLARYIRIPKIGVNARVLQVGVTHAGALGTPANVFDTAWYTGSAKPGQPGATLIDGHVSSWTSPGVFYDLKNLAVGDIISIEKGDSTTINYSVVATKVFDANNVDMSSLMKTAVDGKSGLNLITCGGKYDSKAGAFTKRIAVYAVQQ